MQMDKTMDFIRFMAVVKSQYKQGLYCCSSQGQNCHKTSPARLQLEDFTFPVTNWLQDAWANRPKYWRWKISKLTTLSVALLFFLRDTFDVVGHFIGMNKNYPFW